MTARTYRVKSDPLTRTDVAVIGGAAAAGFLIVGAPLGFLLYVAYQWERRVQQANRVRTSGVRGAFDAAADRGTR